MSHMQLYQPSRYGLTADVMSALSSALVCLDVRKKQIWMNKYKTALHRC